MGHTHSIKLLFGKSQESQDVSRSFVPTIYVRPRPLTGCLFLVELKVASTRYQAIGSHQAGRSAEIFDGKTCSRNKRKKTTSLCC